MKCQCPTETHGHKAGKCNNLATELDRLCKPCHDETAKEMHTARPPDNQPPINQPRVRPTVKGGIPAPFAH